VINQGRFVAGALTLLIALAPVIALADQPDPQAPAQVPPRSSAPVPAPTLAGATWQWEGTRAGDGSSLSVADPTRYTLQFQAGGMLAIRADCNNVLGTYAVSGGQLTIELGPSTLVGCPPDSQADQFLAGLSQVTSYRFAGGSLQLGLSTGGQMTFGRAAAQSLAGPTWELTGYNNGRNAVQSVLTGTTSTAVFGDDGRITGSAGCNTYMGPYQTDGQSLTIGPLATTRMACASPIMDQETAYLAALQKATQYEFESGRLVLRDASGATQATFIRGQG
jgi:heat shock protein HslJ